MLPWKETSALAEQRALLAQWEAGSGVSELARQFGVSRKTVYKRIRRYQCGDASAVGDRSRAPHWRPTRTPVAVEAALVAAKRKKRHLGPKKLLPVLAEQQPELRLPSVSTAGAILRRHGLVRPSRRVRRTPPWTAPFAHAQAANDVWCVDFKGWIRTGDGVRCDPLTVSDAYSRFCLACEALVEPTQRAVQQVLTRVFRQYGLPAAIRTDNGSPFASTGLGGLTPLSVWWIKLGIRPERIAPGRPEQNGRHERFHRTLKEATLQPPKRSQRAQQRAFNRFRTIYNQQRPHEALGQQPPARWYALSPRLWSSRLPSLSYPPEMTIRRVRSNGEIKWRGRKIFLSMALRGEPVGLAPAADGSWTIHAGPLQIGVLDERTDRVIKTPVNVLPMSSR